MIQISTMGGQATFPGASLYHTSKWGIEGFMESLRYELAPFNIGVTIVQPGSWRSMPRDRWLRCEPFSAVAPMSPPETRTRR
ncbi:SDR family NAD(P)-dependent oxidoreductase [Bradyrhizobium semiaridum]|uniref:SDR family NAD(P)-dependent oxidoreductase n=1 Tax=Bradyrhizobium semiaridum TaxID=2821404 RepID=UPI001CE39799